MTDAAVPEPRTAPGTEGAPAPALRRARLRIAASGGRQRSDRPVRRVSGPFLALTLRSLSRAIDVSVLALVAMLALAGFSGTLLHAPLGSALPFVLMPVAMAFGLDRAGAYRLEYVCRPLIQVRRVAAGAGLALAGLVAAMAPLSPLPALAGTVLAGLTAIALLVLLHAGMLLVFRRLVHSGQLCENVVIVGATENAQRLIARNADERELNIVGVFDDRLSRAPEMLGDVPVLGGIDDLIGWEKLPEIDRVIVTVTSQAQARVRTLIDRLRILPQRVVLLLDLDGFDPEQASLAQIARSPAAYVSGRPRDLERALVKRIADLAIAGLLLVCFSPVLAATALAIRLEGPGPIFFRQKRHGFNNQIIRVWKFRSMHPDKGAESRMRQQVTADDPRVTRVGRFIRRTSIDELPQLWNVLKGEMSLVGPRPHAIGMTAEETEVQAIVADYAHRHRVKPGITGWAQINGSRGPVHTQQEVRERVRLDMEYVNRASFWFDLWILLRTGPCLLGDRKRER